MARGLRDFEIRTKRRSFDMPQTWAEFKAAVEDAGVKDGDHIYMIDVGPDADVVLLEKDDVGVEITGGSDAYLALGADRSGGATTDQAQTAHENGRRAHSRSERKGADRVAST